MEQLKLEILQDATIEAMGNYRPRLSRRQQVIASNIANIDTPGYTTKDISFHATMQELLPGPDPGRQMRPDQSRNGAWTFAPAEPEVVEVSGLPSRPDQ